MTTTAETAWRVRVALPGGIIHLVSRIEPVITMHDGRISDVSLDLVTGASEAGDAVGDTLGFIRWPEVIGLTWRLLAEAADFEARPSAWRTRPAAFTKARRRA
jgi:hypothetical protein